MLSGSRVWIGSKSDRSDLPLFCVVMAKLDGNRAQSSISKIGFNLLSAVFCSYIIITLVHSDYILFLSCVSEIVILPVLFPQRGTQIL